MFFFFFFDYYIPVCVCIYIDRQIDRQIHIYIWHHQLNGHEFEQAPGVRDGQGSLACCSPWSCRIRRDSAIELNSTIYQRGDCLIFGQIGTPPTHTHKTHKAIFYICVILETSLFYCYFSAKYRFFSSKSSDQFMCPEEPRYFNNQ